MKNFFKEKKRQSYKFDLKTEEETRFFRICGWFWWHKCLPEYLITLDD